jgi:hypothetical protein
MRDPYEILGVQKNATPAAVKSAFRRLAKKLHPDANKTDKTAATKFRTERGLRNRRRRGACLRSRRDRRRRQAALPGFPGGAAVRLAGRRTAAAGSGQDATLNLQPARMDPAVAGGRGGARGGGGIDGS